MTLNTTAADLTAGDVVEGYGIVLAVRSATTRLVVTFEFGGQRYEEGLMHYSAVTLVHRVAR